LNAHYSQQEAADALSVSIRTYEKWEQGRTSPTVATLVRIATLFDISLDWWLLDLPASRYDDRRVLNGIHNLTPDDRDTVKCVIKAMTR